MQQQQQQQARADANVELTNENVYLWRVERHDEYGDEKVGKRQRNDEGVGNTTQPIVAQDTDNNHQVPDDSRRHYGHQNHCYNGHITGWCFALAADRNPPAVVVRFWRHSDGGQC